MTQDKMRRMITACVSAATVLLVVLLGYLIYQWITISNQNSREEKLLNEIKQIEQEIQAGQDDVDFYKSEFYLQWKLDEIKHKQDLVEGK